MAKESILSDDHYKGDYDPDGEAVYAAHKDAYYEPELQTKPRLDAVKTATVIFILVFTLTAWASITWFFFQYMPWYKGPNFGQDYCTETEPGNYICQAYPKSVDPAEVLKPVSPPKPLEPTVAPN